MSKAGALSLDSSFPLSRFLSPEVVEENLLECPICFLVLKDPFGASCSHICCLHCLKEWLDRDPSCPVCRLPIKRSDLKPLTGPLRNIYDSLKLKCDVEGCRDIITINSIQQHQSSIHKLFTTEKCNRNNEAQNSPVNSQWYKVGDDWNVWTITHLTKSLKDSQMSALSGRYIYVESPMGLTWFEGYSYVIQLYLHGHSRQCPSAVTACVRFVKGSYDDHLKWPFSHKMVIKLLDVPGVQKEVSFPELTDNDNPNRTSGYLELCSRQLLTSLRGDSLRLAVKFIPNKNEKRLIAGDPENHNYLKPNTNDMNNALVRSSRSFSTFPSQNSDKPINTRQSHSPPLTHETYWAPQIPSVNITRPSVMANGTPSTMIDMRRSRNISSSPHYRINMANPTPSVYPQPPPKPQPQPQPQSAPKPQPQPQPQIAKPQPQPQSAPKPQPQAQPVPKPQPVAKLAPQPQPQPSPSNLSPKLGYTRTPTFPNRPDPIQLSPTWNPNLYSARTAVNVVQHNAPKNSAAPRHIADPRRTRLM